MQQDVVKSTSKGAPMGILLNLHLGSYGCAGRQAHPRYISPPAQDNAALQEFSDELLPSIPQSIHCCTRHDSSLSQPAQLRCFWHAGTKDQQAASHLWLEPLRRQWTCKIAGTYGGSRSGGRGNAL